MDIKSIPTNELIEDMAASESDIRLCEYAILQGVKEYTNGSVEYRLEANKKIVAAIEAELERRKAEAKQ
jgi:hypothetical protein